MQNTLRRRGRRGVASIIGTIFFVLILVVALAMFTVIFNSFFSYTQVQNQAEQANIQQQETSLAISDFHYGSRGAPVTSDAATCGSATVSPTMNTEAKKMLFAANMWWAFFICAVGAKVGLFYTTSFDGVTWEAATAVAGSALTGINAGSHFAVDTTGANVYIAVAKLGPGPAQFIYAVGTLAAGGTVAAPAGTITQATAATAIATSATPNTGGSIGIEVDSTGNTWVALSAGTCTTTANCDILVYEHPVANPLGTWSAQVAPASISSGLGANAAVIVRAPPSSLAANGVILVYETGSATARSTGTLAMLTNTNSAPSTSNWNTVTLGTLSDYSVTASSAHMIGSVLCFAGLAAATTGQTSGTLNYWSFNFPTSLTSGSQSTELQIESTSATWQAALTDANNTLVLFDNPSGTGIQAYFSGNFGATWSTAFTIATGESAVNGLSVSDSQFAVEWVNTANNVRFVDLSSATVTDNSAFSINLASLYVSNPSTSSLVTYYYENSTNLFNYWVSPGTSVSTPIYFTYSASTTYSVSIYASNGATVATSVASLA